MSNDLVSRYSEARANAKAAGENVKMLIASLSRAITQLSAPWDRIAISGTPFEVPPEPYEGENNRAWPDRWATPDELAKALMDWRHAVRDQAKAYQAALPTLADSQVLAPPISQGEI